MNKDKLAAAESLISQLRGEAAMHQTVYADDRRRKQLFTDAADLLTLLAQSEPAAPIPAMQPINDALDALRLAAPDDTLSIQMSVFRYGKHHGESADKIHVDFFGCVQDQLTPYASTHRETLPGLVTEMTARIKAANVLAQSDDLVAAVAQSMVQD